jgi:hypothetical protein
MNFRCNKETTIRTYEFRAFNKHVEGFLVSELCSSLL